jgi:DNA-binding PadR family transcriptional regulator
MPMRDNREGMREFMRKFHRIGHLRGYGGLKILVLHLLSEGPKNGAELMDAIDLMSHGHWKPSPGSIYPLLSKAVDEQLLIKREDRKYELSDAGFEEISMFKTGTMNHPDSIESIIAEIDNNLSYLEDLSDDKLAPHGKTLDSIGLKVNRINDALRNAGKGS